MSKPDRSLAKLGWGVFALTLAYVLALAAVERWVH